MRLLLETHKFAPELNVAHIVKNGKTIAQMGKGQLQGVDSIRRARDVLFPLPRRAFKTVEIRKVYPRQWSHLNRIYSGRFTAYKEVLEFVRGIREKEKGGTLFNGEKLPRPILITTTRLVCG